MALLTENTDYFITQGLPNAGVKTLVVSSLATMDGGDKIPLNIANFGGGSVLGVIGFRHTTENSVVVQLQPTTVMDGQTLVLTDTGTGVLDNFARHYLIFLGSTKNPA
jgi:hypothetical protein